MCLFAIGTVSSGLREDSIRRLISFSKSEILWGVFSMILRTGKQYTGSIFSSMRRSAWRLGLEFFSEGNRRPYATKPHDTSKLRNMALVAHIGVLLLLFRYLFMINFRSPDSGKTTLTESILLKSSYLSTPGTVDTGSTTTDFLPVERERGITVQSASIPVEWKDWTFNLIDTPGHADFGMEVECASRVVDGAVVLLDSVEGVEPQTRGVWRQLDRYVQDILVSVDEQTS